MKEKQKTSKSGFLVKVLLNPEIGILIPILIICVVTTMLKPNFLTWKYISSILAGSIFIGAATLGECLWLSGRCDDGNCGKRMGTSPDSLHPALPGHRSGSRIGQRTVCLQAWFKQLDYHTGDPVYLSGACSDHQPGAAHVYRFPWYRRIYQGEAVGTELVIFHFCSNDSGTGGIASQNSIRLLSEIGRR